MIINLFECETLSL